MGRIGEPVTGTVRDDCTVLLVMLNCILTEGKSQICTVLTFCNSEPAVWRLALADSVILTRSSLPCLTFTIITKLWRSVFSSEFHAYANGQFQPKWRLRTLNLKFQPRTWKQDRYERKLGDGQRMIILCRIGPKLWIYECLFTILLNSEPEELGHQHPHVYNGDAHVTGLWNPHYTSKSGFNLTISAQTKQWAIVSQADRACPGTTWLCGQVVIRTRVEDSVF
jgi:hypothetical protein